MLDRVRDEISRRLGKPEGVPPDSRLAGQPPHAHVRTLGRCPSTPCLDGLRHEPAHVDVLERSRTSPASIQVNEVVEHQRRLLDLEVERAKPSRRDGPDPDSHFQPEPHASERSS
jgi:hypothetical protein